ncbi:hypothetical protein [Pontibacter brevis]
MNGGKGAVALLPFLSGNKWVNPNTHLLMVRTGGFLMLATGFLLPPAILHALYT